MANLIAAERISLALGTSQLLDEVSLGVGTGDRIGIVGRNGGGKTTLLSVLAGNQSVDTGRLTRTGGLAVGLLTQQDGMAADTTVASATLGSLILQFLRWLGLGAKARPVAVEAAAARPA